MSPCFTSPNHWIPWSVYGLLDGYFFRWCPIYPSHGTFNNPSINVTPPAQAKGVVRFIFGKLENMMLRCETLRALAAVVWFWNIYQVRKTILKIQGFLCIMAEFAEIFSLAHTDGRPFPCVHPCSDTYFRPCIHTVCSSTRAHALPLSPPISIHARRPIFRSFPSCPVFSFSLPPVLPLLLHCRPVFRYFPIRCRVFRTFPFSHSVQQLPSGNLT